MANAVWPIFRQTLRYGSKQSVDLQGLKEFADCVYKFGSDWIKRLIVPAKTFEHKLSVTLTRLDHCSQSDGVMRVPQAKVSWGCIDRWCTICPQLDGMIIRNLSDGQRSTKRLCSGQKVWSRTNRAVEVCAPWCLLGTITGFHEPQERSGHGHPPEPQTLDCMSPAEA